MVRATRKCLINGKATAAQIKSLQTGARHNNRCVNCTSPNPNYICLDFLTFVCQDCSDVHGSFGHKVAAIEHSEWSPEEFAEIEKFGNKPAAEEFLAFWNETDFPRPHRKDAERLRDFIRKAYVIKCWQRQPDRKRAARKPWDSINKAGQPADASPAAEAAPATDAPAAPASAAAPAPPAEASAPAAAPATPGPALAAPAPAAVVPAAATVAGEAGVPVAAPPNGMPPMALVYLPKDTACFCPDHDSTEKRQKTEPSFKACNGCKLMLQTNYSQFSYCPGCSASRSTCMICGIAVSKYGPDGMPREGQCAPTATADGKCASRESTDGKGASGESSDGIHTDEATSVGNTEGRGEVDFSSSDAEGVDPACSAAPADAAAAAAPRQASACFGNLMDLDVVQAAAPAAAPVAPEATSTGAPVQQASPSDWLGDAIVGAPPPGPVATAAGAPSCDSGLLGDVATGAVAAPAVDSDVPAPAAAPPNEALLGDDWLGEAFPDGPSASISATAPTDPAALSAPLPSAGNVIDCAQAARPEGEPQAQATAAADPFAGLECSAGTSAATKACPANDLFAALAADGFSAAPVQGKPAANELLLQTPKRNTGDVPGTLDQQAKVPEVPAAMNFFCGSPEALPNSSAVQDRFAALGELQLPGHRPLVPQLPQANFGGAGMMQMGSPMSARNAAETPLATMSPQAMMTPQHLDGVPSDQLAQMHALVTRALTQRTQEMPQSGTFSASPSGSSPRPYQMSPPVRGACNTPWSGVPEPPQLAFGDVLSALHEKGRPSEDKQSATPAKVFEAFDSALMNAPAEPEQPKEFGDLLAAFHKKNPIAGLHSMA
mmetsp:Transcript_23551/g.74137  ORF Transcript_23551/g.74137 Transcript_23551/m.74137 type:complete len:834 (-) Transcript_23551:199-2700(-)